MTERPLISSFTASSLIHLFLLLLAAFLIQAKPLKPIIVPIELLNIPRVDVPKREEPKKVEIPPPPPTPQPKPKETTAPKLLSKPVLETSPLPPARNVREENKEKPVEQPPPLPSLPDNTAAAKVGGTGLSEGSAAGTGGLYGKGDVGVVAGSGVSGGGGGTGNSGLGKGGVGDGSGSGSGEALSAVARPLGGYQVKPRYPESARRAGLQGVTRLRVRVLENGRVGEVLVEESAGFRDLDIAAMDAVKKWLFEPARQGKNPVSVWVLLPVKFELHQ